MWYEFIFIVLFPILFALRNTYQIKEIQWLEYKSRGSDEISTKYNRLWHIWQGGVQFLPVLLFWGDWFLMIVYLFTFWFLFDYSLNLFRKVGLFHLGKNLIDGWSMRLFRCKEIVFGVKVTLVISSWVIYLLFF